MLKHKVQFQLVRPHNHRANLAERAIQTFKNYFEAGFSTLHPDFPIIEWDRLLPQAFLTFNLLRQATDNPNLSAYAYLFGNFDFNRTHLAPPGSKVITDNKPSQRLSWDLNGKIVFQVGPAPKRYRCMTCFNQITKNEIISDTLVFISHTIPIPSVNINNLLRQAASDIVQHHYKLVIKYIMAYFNTRLIAS